jgi:hypothetical protein
MSKAKLTAEQLKEISEQMKKVATMQGAERDIYIAKTIGDVYDYEIPVAPMIEAVARMTRAGNRPEDNHVYYMTPESVDKKVFSLVSHCNVTQVQVTPNTRTELNLVPLVSPDFWVCITDFLRGDHDALALYAESINEALNRYEIKNVLALLDAGAVAESNVFGLDSGKNALDFPKIIEMRSSLLKYGTKFVLITGSNVRNDVDLMDYTADTNRPYTLETLGIQHIPVLDYTVETNASGQDELIDDDTAYLVAVSDAKGNKPILVARRQLNPALDMADTKSSGQDRIVIDGGNAKNVGSVSKLARSKVGYEEFGAVLLNSKVVAKFTK